MQIRQVPINPMLNTTFGIRTIHRNVPRGNHQRQQPQQPQTQPRPVNLSGMSFQNKKILIRRQLLLMLHARMCTCEDLIFQRENPNLHRPLCDMPHCALLKTVLTHMKSCTRGRDCTVAHCSSSRQILSHWKNCANNACPVCPARLKPTNYGIVPNNSNPSTTNTNNANGQANVPSPTSTQPPAPIFARNLNRFKSILHAEINILTATFEAVEVGETPTVSSITGEIVPLEE